MPCRDAGPTANELDPLNMLSRINRLTYQVSKLEEHLYKGNPSKVDHLTDMLCWTIRHIPEEQRKHLRTDVREWWKAHEAWDKARNA